MFWLKYEEPIKVLEAENKTLKNKISALEEYLNIKYFNGPNRKAHYRKRKVVVKKLGHPKKK